MHEIRKITGIVIFGVVLSVVLPYIINNHNLENEIETVNQTPSRTYNEVAILKKDESGTPIKQETKEEPKEEVIETNIQEPVTEEIVEPEAEPVVYENMTVNELAEKLNRSLKSTLADSGMTFAKYSVEMGIDPYLAVAIVLHETGCNGTCSQQVKNCYNVGGMKGGPSCNGTSYKKFDSLEDGIYSFMKNLKENYYDVGLTTPEQINTKYATSTAWASKINSYIEKLKAA